jgi:uncharacterized protein YcfJ
LLVALATLTGCSNGGEGALFGAGLGAGAGAIIGSLTGHAGDGAVIGAVAGALGGGVIGDQNSRNAYCLGGATYSYPHDYCPRDRYDSRSHVEIYAPVAPYCGSRYDYCR